MSETVNAQQRQHWNEVAGPAWVKHQERLDRQIRPHGEAVIAALAPRPGEQVLDVGCGCGETTLELARRVAPGGSALGLDLSAPMLARARERAAEEGIANAEFREDDAQRAELPAGTFDAIASRFGVMFFEDPDEAFANLRRAANPGARLAFVCWQGPARNPWVTLPGVAVAPLLEMPAPAPPDAPGMFALADPDRTRRVLTAGGWQQFEISDFPMEISPGGDESVEGAVEFYLAVGPIAGLVREQATTPEKQRAVRDALRSALERHAAGGPLRFDSAAWLVTARAR